MRRSPDDEIVIEIRRATAVELDTYVAFARAAQQSLRQRGLGQYVPAAHAEYAGAIRARIASETLFTAHEGGVPLAFFILDATPSPWWPADGASATYLSGMVVGEHARGRGVGRRIIEWCVEETRRRRRRCVRLDCHADNRWLCRYYERQGFVARGLIEQHPGYHGCLYELAAGEVAPGGVR